MTTGLTRAYQHSLNSSTVPPGQPVLEVKDIGLRFGGVHALQEVGFTVTQGHIHAVIGPNGAGKSSLLNCVSGLYHPQQGSIVLHTGGATGSAGTTHELTKLAPHRIARLGVARSFQNIELFSHLTVLENLMLGRHIHMSKSVAAALLWFGPARRQEIEHRALVEEVIDLLSLQAHRHKPVGSLAYGIQKRVELGRALAEQLEQGDGVADRAEAAPRVPLPQLRRRQRVSSVPVMPCPSHDRSPIRKSTVTA